MMARFQKRNQIVQVQRDVSLQSAVECSQPHAFVSVAQPRSQGRFVQGRMAHAGRSNRIVSVLSQSLCNAGVVHEKQGPCCLALDDAVFVVQGAEGEWNTVLTQRGKEVGTGSANVQVAMGEECLNGFASRENPHIR